MKWFDGLRDWYADDQNRLVTNVLCGATAVVTLVLGSLLFFTGRAIVNSIEDETVVTIADGCVNAKGLVLNDAPRSCFVPTPYTAVAASVPGSTAPIVKPVYDPPCAAGSDAHGCNDRIYGKRLLEGTIDTVKFYGDEPTLTGSADSVDRHLQPDYTEVTFLAPSDDQQAETINVCGNQLEHFNPGQHVKRIIKESTLADYDGCYTLYMNFLTFGGKNVQPGYSKSGSKVPGPGSVKDLKECEHTSGGTCG